MERINGGRTKNPEKEQKGFLLLSAHQMTVERAKILKLFPRF
jgi:hypothetical protein